MKPQLADIGANLTHPAFRDDLDEVVARARSAGVSQSARTSRTRLFATISTRSSLARDPPACRKSW